MDEVKNNPTLEGDVDQEFVYHKQGALLIGSSLSGVGAFMVRML